MVHFEHGHCCQCAFTGGQVAAAAAATATAAASAHTATVYTELQVTTLFEACCVSLQAGTQVSGFLALKHLRC